VKCVTFNKKYGWFADPFKFFFGVIERLPIIVMEVVPTTPYSLVLFLIHILKLFFNKFFIINNTFHIMTGTHIYDTLMNFVIFSNFKDQLLFFSYLKKNN
jgi:hypothetical protein